MWRLICLTLCLFGFLLKTNAKKACEINFDLKSDLIVVSAEINGQTGAFILDTAAPTLVLNTAYFTGEYRGMEAQGLHKTVPVAEKNIQDFRWGCLQKRNIEAVILDLSHFEESLDIPLLGLIGYEVLKNWEILFDYANLQLGLQKGRNESVSNSSRVLTSIPFDLVDHLVSFELMLGEQNYSFILDSASGANLLNKQIKNEQLQYVQAPIIIGSADKGQGIYQQAIALESSISDIAFFNQLFVRINLENIIPNLDGLLGFPFLSCCKISIDYKKQQLTIWTDEVEETLAGR